MNKRQSNSSRLYFLIYQDPAKAVFATLIIVASLQSTPAQNEMAINDSLIQADSAARQLNEQITEPCYAKVTDAKQSNSEKMRISAAPINNNTWNYVGNKQSLKFHKASCEFACKMADLKQVRFQFSQDAIDIGMKPCHWCLPQWWTQVEGRIIKSAPAPGATNQVLGISRDEE